MDPHDSFKVPTDVPGITNKEVEVYKHQINEVELQVGELEQKVQEIESFYSEHCENQNINSERNFDGGNHATGIDTQQVSEAALERMKNLMTQFSTLMNQVIQMTGAGSFLDSLCIKDPALLESLEADGKPTDFNMIKMRMEMRDGSGYNHVKDIYSDVRFILKYTMKNSDEKSDTHIAAETLLTKFEEKWYTILPKVMQEEALREEEEASHRNYCAQIANNLSKELSDVEVHLKELREHVLQKCRKFSALEKRELGKSLAQLSAEDLLKALEIVAQSNPALLATPEEVNLDLNVQDEYTLWQLQCFVTEALQAQRMHSTAVDDGNDNDNTHITSAKPIKASAKPIKVSVKPIKAIAKPVKASAKRKKTANSPVKSSKKANRK